MLENLRVSKIGNILVLLLETYILQETNLIENSKQLYFFKESYSITIHVCLSVGKFFIVHLT